LTDAATPLAANPAANRSFYKNPFVWAFLIGCVFITGIRPFLRFEPDPPPVVGQVPGFTLVDPSGAPFGSDDLTGRVYVASFFFTRCRSICPTLMRSVAALERRYVGEGIEGIHLISVSVDPQHDTPAELERYARSLDVDPTRWTLLTGETDAVRDLVVGGFKTALGSATGGDTQALDIAHTGKLVLVDDRGKIRGYYDSDALGIDELFHRSQHVLQEARKKRGAGRS